MTRYLLILGMITAGVLVSGLWPVHLPVAVSTALATGIDWTMAMVGIVNMASFYSLLITFLNIQIALFAFILFRFIIGS